MHRGVVELGQPSGQARDREIGKSALHDLERNPDHVVPALARVEPLAVGRLDTPRPLVGGGDKAIEPGGVQVLGPSPRGRGRQGDARNPDVAERTIPAWAGETPMTFEDSRNATDHPRVGGGDPTVRLTGHVSGGPSPRGRGRREIAGCCANPIGTIPAWAGETSMRSRSRLSLRDHPRVGGGDTFSIPSSLGNLGPSPRGRGRPVDALTNAETLRTIPAWAGETPTRSTCPCPPPDHPRVGGGDLAKIHHALLSPGPSPRGRGRRSPREARPRPDGTIPAWAGETSRA